MTQITLKEARQNLRWTQTRLAAELGVSRRSVATYEQGIIPARMLKLASLILNDAAKRQFRPCGKTQQD